MADSAQVEGRNGGGSGKPPERRPHTTHAQAAYSHTHARAYEYALVYTHARASVSLAVKGSGLLALLLSTVVLLGGFVSSLRKTDFFCITVISMIQAAGSVISSYLIALHLSIWSLQVLHNTTITITPSTLHECSAVLARLRNTTINLWDFIYNT